MSKKCKLTSKDTIQVTSEGFIVNGHLKKSLKGCVIEEGARFIMLVKEEDKPQPLPAGKPSSLTTPQVQVVRDFSEKSVEHQASISHLPPEMQEIRELMSLYQSAQGFGPYVALLMVAYVLWRRTNLDKSSCASCRRRAKESQQEHHTCHCDKCKQDNQDG